MILQTLHSLLVGSGQVQYTNTHLFAHGRGWQVEVKDQTGNLSPVIAAAASECSKTVLDAY